MKLVQKTIGRCLRETAERFPDHTAIEFEGWSCTWAELDEVTDNLAARFFSKYGIRNGTHVGIWSLNSPAFVQGCLALYKLGAVVVVLNVANSVDEMVDQLVRSDSEVLFYGHAGISEKGTCLQVCTSGECRGPSGSGRSQQCAHYGIFPC